MIISLTHDGMTENLETLNNNFRTLAVIRTKINQHMRLEQQTATRCTCMSSCNLSFFSPHASVIIMRENYV
jgi:hypothetical protein